MDFDDLVTTIEPPPNRARYSGGLREQHLYEGAVMLAYAMHLLRTHGTREIEIHPDGQHAKQFDLAAWLERRNFIKIEPRGRTPYGGVYRNSEGQTVNIEPKSGLGDVVAQLDGHKLVAECKGGIINTRHPGQSSRLYRGLCETVGLLMATPSEGRHVAVVPWHERTLSLAKRLAPRCDCAGIEIALVGGRGEVMEVNPQAAGASPPAREDE